MKLGYGPSELTMGSLSPAKSDEQGTARLRSSSVGMPVARRTSRPSYSLHSDVPCLLAASRLPQRDHPLGTPLENRRCLQRRSVVVSDLS